VANRGKPELELQLKYYAGRPVIERIERVEQAWSADLPKVPKICRAVMQWLGCCHCSTSSGVMTDRHARAKGVGR